MNTIPEHGMCFTCGQQNPHGIGMQWYYKDDHTITGAIALDEHQQGPPGFVHGGATSALLDEAMGMSVWVAGYQVVATNLNIAFKAPVPLGQVVIFTAWVTSKEVIKDRCVIFTAGQAALPDGTVAVTSEGRYKEAPHIFAQTKVAALHVRAHDTEENEQ